MSTTTKHPAEIVDDVRVFRNTARIFDRIATDPDVPLADRKKARRERAGWENLFDQAVQASVDAGVRWVTTLAILPDGTKIDIA